ncbi:MAG: hypothetical protein WD048_09780 [Chitinophagales bacterium]
MADKIDYYKDINKLNPESGRLIFRRTVTSTCFFILTFYTAVFLNHAVSAYAAKIMGYDPVLKYFEVSNLPMDWEHWSKLRVFVFYSSGPLFVLFVGLISWHLHSLLKKTSSIFKPVTLWFSFNCIVLFLSYVIVVVLGTGSYNSPFYYGFSVIASWYWFGKPLMAPVTLLGVGFSALYAFFVSRSFLELSSSYKRINNLYGKRAFVFYNVVLPVFIGSVIILVLRADKDFIESLVTFISAVIVVFVIWLRSIPKISGLKIVKSDTLDFPVGFSLILLLVFLALLSWFFENGLVL